MPNPSKERSLKINNGIDYLGKIGDKFSVWLNNPRTSVLESMDTTVL